MVKPQIHPGELPTFWNRSVVFFANITSLFFGNKDEMEELEKKVSAVDTYGGRLAPILNILFKGEKNLLVLEKEPDQSILRYFKNDLALSLPEFLIVSPETYHSVRQSPLQNEKGLYEILKKISNIRANWVDGFVTDHKLVTWARKVGKTPVTTPAASRICNNKLRLYEHKLKTGLPVFDTEIATSPEDVAQCLTALNKKKYKKAVVKSQIGASGVGMLRVDTSAGSPEIPEYMFFEGHCLVQGWIDEAKEGIESITSPSAQLFIGESSTHIYDVTEQILSKESVHEGNISPPPYWNDRAEIRDELLAQASVAANWLHSNGYRGTASVDFHLAWHEKGAEVRICEINARVTGATYPSVLARHFLPTGTWVMRNLKTEEPTEGEKLLRTLDKNGVLFRPGMEEGYLPINFNLDNAGRVIKGQFLYIGNDPDVCVNALEDFAESLPSVWASDRD